MTSVCLCNQSMLRHPKINWYSGMLSTINQKRVYCAGSWVHAAPSGPCISNSSPFKINFFYLYSLYLVGKINNKLLLNRFQNSKNLVHLKWSPWGKCEYLEPYPKNEKSIEGKHATVWHFCYPSYYKGVDRGGGLGGALAPHFQSDNLYILYPLENKPPFSAVDMT